MGVVVYPENMKIRSRLKVTGGKFTGLKVGQHVGSLAKRFPQGNVWAQIDEMPMGRLRNHARTSTGRTRVQW